MKKIVFSCILLVFMVSASHGAMMKYDGWFSMDVTYPDTSEAYSLYATWSLTADLAQLDVLDPVEVDSFTMMVNGGTSSDFYFDASTVVAAKNSYGAFILGGIAAEWRTPHLPLTLSMDLDDFFVEYYPVTDEYGSA